MFSDRDIEIHRLSKKVTCQGLAKIFKLSVPRISEIIKAVESRNNFIKEGRDKGYTTLVVALEQGIISTRCYGAVYRVTSGFRTPYNEFVSKFKSGYKLKGIGSSLRTQLIRVI